MSDLVVNKKAGFDYELLETYEAGLVLLGHEVKSLKSGNGSLKSSFIIFKQTSERRLPEAFLKNCYIPLYEKASTVNDYDPERERKILINKNEIRYLIGKRKEQGLTLIPLRIYTKRGLIKLAFALARGKKKYDKREDIKKRELDRQARTMMKRKMEK